MPIGIVELKRLQDKGFIAGQINRERAADDQVFLWVTQWDDQTWQDSTLGMRGEFDLLRKSFRHIKSELAENEVQIDFEGIEETGEDEADLLDGIYRTEDTQNTTIEAYAQAEQEAVVCGYGAWLLYTEYVTMNTGNRNQVIRRRPLYEANNNSFWDPNAKLLDKSDADWFSFLEPFTDDGYKKLYEELTGEELETISMESFSSPEHSYTFPWVSGEGKKIYIVEFYHREKVKTKILTMVNPFGEEIELRASDVKDVLDDMLDEGFEIEAEKIVDMWEVRKYIASGAEILNGETGEDGEREGELIIGEEIPAVPFYGERTYIEGEEVYEGFVRLAKDPQRLRNYALSYMGDILSRTPRPKPIYQQEQIAGFEHMYNITGSDDNFPYLLQNRLDAQGDPLPYGAVAVSPEQVIPQSVFEMIDQTRQSVADVADPGIPQDVADPDMSGKAIYALQARIDKQSIEYNIHRKHAKRRDSKIYAGMASVIYDVPRTVVITKPDGTRSEAKVMDEVYDKETGDTVVINDIHNAKFETYSKIGPSYSSQKEQTVERLSIMNNTLSPDDPMKRAVQLKIMGMMPGVDMDDLKEYSKRELILSGFKKPETDEEIQMLEEAQNQQKEPDAAMVLAQGELLKGEAAKEKNQIELMKVQGNTQNENMKRMIDKFEAMTNRMDTQISAQEANAKIENTRIDTFSKQIDNAAKTQAVAIADMGDEDLMQIAMGG